jgi:hypothetical protein
MRLSSGACSSSRAERNNGGRKGTVMPDLALNWNLRSAWAMQEL